MRGMKRVNLLIFFFTIFISAVPAVHAVTTNSESLSGIQLFPSDYIWNVPVDTLPVDPRSVIYINSIGEDTYLRADFGTGGIPYNVVDNTQEIHNIAFRYAFVSDHVSYPIPDNPLMEGGGTPETCKGDCHVLIVNRDTKYLYEIFDLDGKYPNGTYKAGSGAVYNLASYTLRPSMWASADAGGLPILPALVKYDEVNAGEINHALRVALVKTNASNVWPAIAYVSNYTDGLNPPFGQRFRLKSSFDTSEYPEQTRVILNALKKYGMIVVDNGVKDIAISGVPDTRWSNSALWALRTVKATDFEAVDSSSLMISKTSGKARISPAVTPTPILITDLDNEIFLIAILVACISTLVICWGIDFFRK